MITIDDPDLEAMLRVITETTGDPPAVVVRRALVQALGAPRGDTRRADPLARTPEEIEAVIARIARIQADVARLPVLDPRPADEMLYDEHGLPK